MELTFEQVRVLAALIEKEITTPEYYPLTLKALTAACNQKSNREPVVQFDDALIQFTLTELRDKGLIWRVGGPGTRVDKYEQRLTEKLSFDRHQTAIMCELMLRGPQTMGELKGHGSRMYPFSHNIQLETALENLQQHAQGPLIAQLEKRPGQKEPRYTHLFCGMPEITDDPLPTIKSSPTKIAELEARIEALEAAFERFRAQFE
ncbi:MAG: YceH family protein [Acidobacteria bacterium]|nr:YceH family protein [Acidobacteriota bacterium]